MHFCNSQSLSEHTDHLNRVKRVLEKPHINKLIENRWSGLKCFTFTETTELAFFKLISKFRFIPHTFENAFCMPQMI